MELIIKPTGRCNMNCKFCSAGELDIQHPADEKVPQQIKDLIQEIKPNTIIVTGGEPLMMQPSYYYELHELTGGLICPTSNLKDFYLHPDKWVDLFKEKWFSVTTSFNYGDTRRWDADTPFTEEKFIEVINMVKDLTGRPPTSFIAVIDESNEHTAMDHVILAKKLGMQVKLNNAIAVGRQKVHFPRYKIFKYYMDIIDAGLDDYERYCSIRKSGICPFNIDMMCSTSIRCCYVDHNGKLHVGTCDEELSGGIELTYEEACKTVIEYCPAPLPASEYITPECVYCELFRLCNGCHQNRRHAKEDPNFCSEMKKLESRIIKSGWKL